MASGVTTSLTFRRCWRKRQVFQGMRAHFDLRFEFSGIGPSTDARVVQP